MVKPASLLVAAVVLACASSVSGHSYHLGNCPEVDPMPGFKMSKFLGLWYVLQKTSTGSRCLYYNITGTAEDDKYSLEQVSEHLALGVAKVDNKYRYTGTLTVPSKEDPARMTVKFPLNVIGESSFVVFSTDYENYGAVYTCQKLPASNRRSVSLLSRKRTLDKMFIDKVRDRMNLLGLNPFDLSLIGQEGCPDATFIDFGIQPKAINF